MNCVHLCTHLFWRKNKIHVCRQETSHRLQKNVLLNRKLSNGQETKDAIIEISQAWIRLLTNEDPAGKSDKGAECLLKNYSCKLPDWWFCWQDPWTPPDKAGPKGLQPLSTLDAEASARKAIKNFLCIYSKRLTRVTYQKKDTLANRKKLDLLTDNIKRRIFYWGFTYNTVMHP